MTAWHRWGVLLLIGLCGCSAGQVEGGESAAREHLDSEFRKWMTGQENAVATPEARAGNLLNPVSYDVRSVLPDEPDPLAFDRTRGLPEDWKSWPAHRFNVVIEWRSKATTPVESVTTYRLTWNPHERTWYVAERFE